MLAPAVNAAVTHSFAAGFSFPFYGTTYSQVHVAENGVLGFGSLANLNAMAGIPGGATMPVTNSVYVLGSGGTVAPPNIGFFEDLTQSQIAKKLGISQMHVSRLLSQSLSALRGRLLAEV